MTDLEIILISFTSLTGVIMGAKAMWKTIMHRKDKNTEVELAKLQNENKIIHELREQNKLMARRLDIVEGSLKEIKVGFNILYPSLKTIVSERSDSKEALDRLAGIIFQTEIDH